MTDIVEQLMEAIGHTSSVESRLYDAAYEIGYLRDTVERLRDALLDIIKDCEADYPPSYGAIKYAARAALGEKE